MHVPSYCILRPVFTISHQESGRTTVNNVSFTCGVDNRMLAIVGPVGAGKVSAVVIVSQCQCCGDGNRNSHF